MQRTPKRTLPFSHCKRTVLSPSVTLPSDMTQILALNHKGPIIFVTFFLAIQSLSVNLLSGRRKDSDPNVHHQQGKLEVSCYKITSVYHCNIEQLQNKLQHLVF